MVMARFSRGMALRPVHRIKHVVDSSATIAAGTQLPTDLIKTEDAPVLGSSNAVETGSKCYGIYLKVIAVSNENEVPGAIPNVYMTVSKNPAHALNAIVANAVGIDDLKKYVIHQEMVMIQNINGGNPTTVFNGVIKIPKGYARNGPNDRLQVDVLCPAVNIAICIQAHYKEFR